MRLALLVLASLILLGVSTVKWDTRRWLDSGYTISSPDYGYGRVYKFGFHTDIDNTEESVWEGASFPSLTDGPPRCPQDTSAFTLNISSDNAGDTGVIRVEGVDAGWDAVSVDVTLAGVTFTQVGTATNWLRINRAFNMGTTDLAGVVYLHTDDVDTGGDGEPDLPATQTKAVINGGENQTLQACYTVPDNWEAYLSSISLSALTGGAGDPVDFRLRHSSFGGIARVQTLHGLGSGSTLTETFDPPLPYPARSFLEITATSSGAASNGNVSGTFNLALFPTR